MKMQEAKSQIVDSHQAVESMCKELTKFLSQIEKDERLIAQSTKSSFERTKIKKDQSERLKYFDEHPDALNAIQSLPAGFARQTLQSAHFAEHFLSNVSGFVTHLLNDYDEKTIDIFADDFTKSATTAKSLRSQIDLLLTELHHHRLTIVQQLAGQVSVISNELHESLERMGNIYIEQRVQQCFPRKQDNSAALESFAEKNRPLPELRLFGTRISCSSFNHCVGDKINLSFDMDLTGDLSKGVVIVVSGSLLTQQMIEVPKSDPLKLVRDNGDFMLAYVRLSPVNGDPASLSDVITHPDFKDLAQWKLRLRYSVLSKAIKEGSGTLKVSIYPTENSDHGCEREATIIVHGLDKKSFVEREQKLGIFAAMAIHRRKPDSASLTKYNITQNDIEHKASWLQAEKWHVREY